MAANGLSFAYVEAGSDPLVVFVHGSMFDYREWSKQLKPLATHFRVIAYSPTTNVDASLDVQV